MNVIPFVLNVNNFVIMKQRKKSIHLYFIFKTGTFQFEKKSFGFCGQSIGNLLNFYKIFTRTR